MIDRPQRNSILGTVLTLTAFAASASIIPPLITTIAAEIGTDYNNFGYILMLQFFSFFLAGISGGWIGERFDLSCRKLVTCGLFIIFATLLTGSLLRSISHFTIWAIPLGFGGGLVEVFGSIMISNHEKPNSGKLMNLSQVFFCIGAITAPLIVSVFLYFNIPWQIIFVIFSIIILSITAIFLLMTRKETLIKQNLEPEKTTAIPLLKDKMFYLLTAMLLIYVTFETFFTCWLSVYFEKGLSCSAHASAQRIVIFWFGVILGRLATSIMPARLSLWPAVFSGTILMCITSFFASISLTPTVVTILVFLVGIGAGPLWPTIIAICHVARNRQKFTSSVIAIGALGVVAGSYIGALIIKHLGFGSFFPIATFGFVLLLTLSYISKLCSKTPLDHPD